MLRGSTRCVAVTAAFCCMLFYSPPAGAPYLTNLQGSAEASASAFDAMSELFAGVAALEREDIEDADERFDSAVSSLLASQDEFKDLLDTEAAERRLDISRLPVTQQQLLAEMGLTLEEVHVGDLIDLTIYNLSLIEEAINKFRKWRDLDSYSQLRELVSETLLLGEIASRLLAS